MKKPPKTPSATARRFLTKSLADRIRSLHRFTANQPLIILRRDEAKKLLSDVDGAASPFLWFSIKVILDAISADPPQTQTQEIGYDWSDLRAKIRKASELSQDYSEGYLRTFRANARREVEEFLQDLCLPLPCYLRINGRRGMMYVAYGERIKQKAAKERKKREATSRNAQQSALKRHEHRLTSLYMDLQMKGLGINFEHVFADYPAAQSLPRNEFDRVQAFIHGTKPGYFFITGPAGSGKTDLMLQLIRRNNQSSCHFFLFSSPNALSIHTCLTHLYYALQLNKHEVVRNTFAIINKGLLSSQIKRTAKNVLQRRGRTKGATLILIIDALDEAISEFYSTPPSSFLPSGDSSEPLPNNVRIVVSARDRSFLSTLKNVGEVSLAGEPADNLVKDLWQKLCSEHAESPIIRDRLLSIAGDVVQKAEGSPLYVKMVFNDILPVAHDQVPLATLLPQGLRGLYLKYWECPSGKALSEGSIRSIYQTWRTLALLQDPLPLESVRFLSGLSEGEWVMIKSVLFRYLKPIYVNLHECHTLFHRSFSEFILDAEMTPPDKVVLAHKRIVNGLIEAISIDEPSREYATHHRIHHLYWSHNYGPILDTFKNGFQELNATSSSNMMQPEIPKSISDNPNMRSLQQRDLMYILAASIHLKDPLVYYESLCALREVINRNSKLTALHLSMLSSSLLELSLLPPVPEHANLFLAAAYVADYQGHDQLADEFLRLSLDAGGFAVDPFSHSGITVVADILLFLSKRHAGRVIRLVETMREPEMHRALVTSRVCQGSAIPFQLRRDWLRASVKTSLQRRLRDKFQHYLIRKVYLALNIDENHGVLKEVWVDIWKALRERWPHDSVDQFLQGILRNRPCAEFHQLLIDSLKAVQDMSWVKSHRTAEFLIRVLIQESLKTLNTLVTHCQKNLDKDCTVFLDTLLALSQSRNAPDDLEHLGKEAVRTFESLVPKSLMPGYFRHLMNMSDKGAKDYLMMIKVEGAQLWKFLWACRSDIVFPEETEELFPSVPDSPGMDFYLSFIEHMNCEAFGRIVPTFLQDVGLSQNEKVHGLCLLLGVTSEPSEVLNHMDNLIAEIERGTSSTLEIISEYAQRGVLDYAISNQGRRLIDVLIADTTGNLSLWTAICERYSSLGREKEACLLASAFLDRMTASLHAPHCLSLLASHPFLFHSINHCEDRVLSVLRKLFPDHERARFVDLSPIGSALAYFAVAHPAALSRIAEFACVELRLKPMPSYIIEKTLDVLCTISREGGGIMLDRILDLLLASRLIPRWLLLSPELLSALDSFLFQRTSLREMQTLLLRLLSLFNAESRSELLRHLSDRFNSSDRIDDALICFGSSQTAYADIEEAQEARVLTASRVAMGNARQYSLQIISSLLSGFRGSRLFPKKVLDPYGMILLSSPGKLDAETHRILLQTLAESTNGDGQAAAQIITTLLGSSGDDSRMQKVFELIKLQKAELAPQERVKLALCLLDGNGELDGHTMNKVVNEILCFDNLDYSDFQKILLSLKMCDCKHDVVLIPIISALRNNLYSSSKLRDLFHSEYQLTHCLSILAFLNRDREKVRSVCEEILALMEYNDPKNRNRELFAASLKIGVGKIRETEYVGMLQDNSYISKSALELMELVPILLCLHEMAAREERQESLQKLEGSIREILAEIRRRFQENVSDVLSLSWESRGESVSIDLFWGELFRYVLQTDYAFHGILEAMHTAIMERVNGMLHCWLPWLTMLIRYGTDSPIGRGISNIVEDVAGTIIEGFDSHMNHVALVAKLNNGAIKKLCRKHFRTLDGVLKTATQSSPNDLVLTVDNNTPSKPTRIGEFPTQMWLLEILFETALDAEWWDKAEGYIKMAASADQKNLFLSRIIKALASRHPRTSWNRLYEIRGQSLRSRIATETFQAVFTSFNNSDIHKLANLLPYEAELSCRVLEVLLDDCTDDIAFGFAKHLVKTKETIDT